MLNAATPSARSSAIATPWRRSAMTAPLQQVGSSEFSIRAWVHHHGYKMVYCTPHATPDTAHKLLIRYSFHVLTAVSRGLPRALFECLSHTAGTKVCTRGPRESARRRMLRKHLRHTFPRKIWCVTVRGLARHPQCLDQAYGSISAPGPLARSGSPACRLATPPDLPSP